VGRHRIQLLLATVLRSSSVATRVLLNSLLSTATAPFDAARFSVDRVEAFNSTHDIMMAQELNRPADSVLLDNQFLDSAAIQPLVTTPCPILEEEWGQMIAEWIHHCSCQFKSLLDNLIGVAMYFHGTFQFEPM
jgi:hypothetical protein